MIGAGSRRWAARRWAGGLGALLPLATLAIAAGATPAAEPTPAAPAAQAAPAAAAAAARSELDRLMGMLARRRHAQADFEERQYLAVLTRPLVSSGILIYDAPDHLEQRTLRPRRQTMVLDHGLLTLQVGRRRRSVPLADYPRLAPLIDSIRATLAGDRAALERAFTLQLRGGLDHWQLRLQPRAPPRSAGIRDIIIDGAQAHIDEVQLRQSDGDHAVLRIRPRR